MSEEQDTSLLQKTSAVVPYASRVESERELPIHSALRLLSKKMNLILASREVAETDICREILNTLSNLITRLTTKNWLLISDSASWFLMKGSSEDFVFALRKQCWYTLIITRRRLRRKVMSIKTRAVTVRYLPYCMLSPALDWAFGGSSYGFIQV